MTYSSYCRVPAGDRGLLDRRLAAHPDRRNATSHRPASVGAPRRDAVTSDATDVTVGSLLELECDHIVAGGQGLCRSVAGLPVFVDGALPGERLVARVTRVRKGYLSASKAQVLAPHHDAVVPPCEHFGACGGCTLQGLAYHAQLAAKQRIVADALARVAKSPREELERVLLPILGAEGSSSSALGSVEGSSSSALGSSSSGGNGSGDGGNRGDSSGAGGPRSGGGADEGAQQQQQQQQAQGKELASAGPAPCAQGQANAHGSGNGCGDAGAGIYRYRNNMRFAAAGRRWQPGPATADGGAGGGPNSSKNGSSAGPGKREGHVQEGRFTLGLQRRGRNDQVLAVRDCWLQDERANLLLSECAAALEPLLAPRQARGGRGAGRESGVLQELVIRSSSSTSAPSAPVSSDGQGSSGSDREGAPRQQLGASGLAASGGNGSGNGGGKEYLVAVLTSREVAAALTPFAASLRERFPDVAGVVNVVAAPAMGSGGAAATAAASPAVPARGKARRKKQQGVHRRHGGSGSGTGAGGSTPWGQQQEWGGGGVGGGGEDASWPREEVLSGRGYLEERLCGLHFRVSATSFFQTHTQQAEALYRLVQSAAGLRRGDVLLDLFCGTGTIGMCLLAAVTAKVSGSAERLEGSPGEWEGPGEGVAGSGSAGQLEGPEQGEGPVEGEGSGSQGDSAVPVRPTTMTRLVGLDSSESAIRDAQANAHRNGLAAQSTFLRADLEDAGGLLGQVLPRPDVVVTDPARAGMSRQLVSFLRRSGARRIVYVSCDPATMARDIALLGVPTAATAAPTTATAAAAGRGNNNGGDGGGGEDGGGGGGAAVGGNKEGEGLDDVQPQEACHDSSYELVWVRPVDMFPHTAHVEAVALLDCRRE